MKLDLKDLGIKLEDMIKRGETYPVSLEMKSVAPRKLDVFVNKNLAHIYKSMEQMDFLYGLYKKYTKSNVWSSERFNTFRWVIRELNERYPGKMDRKTYVELKKEFNKLITITTNSAYVQVSRKFDWKAGYFGERYNNGQGEVGSCWWGSKSAALPTLFHNGGFAFKFWNNAKATDPAGRCWGVFQPKVGLVMFNGYSLGGFTYPNQNWLEMYSKMVANHFGLQSGRIGLTCNGVWDGEVYINKGVGYLVSSKDILENNLEWNLAWKIERPASNCLYCGSFLIDPNGFEVSQEGVNCCLKCAEEHFDYCFFDMKLYDTSNLITGPDGKKYYKNNISKVPYFVRDARSPKWLLKDKAFLVGNNRHGDTVYTDAPGWKLCQQCYTLFEGDDIECKPCKMRAQNRMTLETRGLWTMNSSDLFELTDFQKEKLMKTFYNLDIGDWR